MPRLYTSANDPLDFCRKCWPSENDATETYGNIGDGPDKRGNCFGYDADHPAYEECDEVCETCGKRLTKRDNYIG